MEHGRTLSEGCFLCWADSADPQSYVSSRLYCAIQDMNYVYFSALLNLLTATDLLFVALKALKGLLTAARKKQMYGAALSGWKPSCSQPLGILCLSCLLGFFLCKYQPMSQVQMQVSLGKPRGRGRGTVAAGHSLWPWDQAGASRCQSWQGFVPQTWPGVAVPHPIKTPFICTLQIRKCRSSRSEPHSQPFCACAALVTGCMTKQPKNPHPGQPLQHSCPERGCRQPKPLPFILIFFC